ncbi:MAG: hypothetical protein ACR2HV_11075 [Acidimicrobiales bacterium]
MDVPPAAGIAAEQPPAPEPYEPTTAELADSLEAVEEELTRLGGRIEALAVSLEASLQAAVASEVHAAAADIRHTVSELGRILVRDLGKLPQMLTQHRQAIVTELRGTGRSTTGAGAGTRVDRVDRVEADTAVEVPAIPEPPVAAEPDGVEVSGDEAEVGGAEDDGADPRRPADNLGVDAEGSGDRSWRHLRRHRQA